MLRNWTISTGDMTAIRKGPAIVDTETWAELEFCRKSIPSPNALAGCNAGA